MKLFVQKLQQLIRQLASKKLAIKSSYLSKKMLSQVVKLHLSNDWNQTVLNAKKVVQYSTYFSFKDLSDDETSNVMLHLNKLVETDHSPLEIAK